ncbi:HPF/RaiA family ribosome-associated protein [Dongia deserti]|uniref:HPF/RaiA family ribosome-associated protein n=1 Tax=Dongia deserti TaxID=2268030 RepID=UPI000E651254|nr:HPF/RaiA family ribosome-associated protein [Dongia deserti]
MQRPLEIAFKDLDSSDFVRNLVEERVDRLERFHPHIIGCRVVIEATHRSAEGHHPPLGISVEVDVANRPRIVAKDSEAQRSMKGDHLAAINRAFEAVERQLENLSDRQRGEVKFHENARQTGSIVRLFPEQGYGFIEIGGGPELYFTRNAMVDGNFDELKVGTMVQVTQAISEGPMGPQASSVGIVSAQRRR